MSQKTRNQNRRTRRTGTATLLLVAFVLLPCALAAEQSPGREGGGVVREEASAPPDPAPATWFEGSLQPAAGLVLAQSAVETVEPTALPSTGGAWVSQGPGPIHGGQVEGIFNGVVIGAIHTVVAHPTNPDILWIGAVNGGVWKTTNATNADPTWTQMGDAFSSLSIGALQRDPTDGTHNTLVAGAGLFSSFAQVGGPRTGLFRTTNGGTSWSALSPAILSAKNISAVAPRGATIVLSVNFAEPFSCINLGIFRSVDTGANFTRISGGVGTGIPMGRAFDLATDPTNNAVLYTAIRDTSAIACNAGSNGVYKSVDTGATWTKVSDATMDALMTDASGFNNAKLAVGMSGEVYVGMSQNGQLAGLFRSGNGGTSWVQLDTPKTNENGTDFGMNPREKPGAQGGLHFAIVADPTDSDIVYVGGDRQPGDGDAGGSVTFPNSIGATNYTGRLFRVDSSAGAGTQATPLTHCATATAACNGTTSTFSNSAPHADARRMVFDFNGNIIEADDGGLYRRTNPRTTGDWFSVMGNLRVTEAHDVAWDAVSNMLISGNQDTGTSEQTTVGGFTWNQVSQGDGGDISVDDVSSGTQSTRYSSFQNLASFRRRTMNASGVATATDFPARNVLSGPVFIAQFVTPVELNAVDPTRILFGGLHDLYESLDRGDTITALGLGSNAFPGVSNRPTAALVYGGVTGGVDNVDLIYAISNRGLNPDGPNVFVRLAGAGAPVQTATSPGTAILRDVAVDFADSGNAWVVNAVGEVFSTVNTGAIWTNVTGNLPSGTTVLRTIAFVPGSPDAIVVGGNNGVFRMATDNPGVWNQFGTGMSNAPVWDLDYDAADDMLAAATMGRGVWTLTPVSDLGPVPSISIGDATLPEGNAGSTNASFAVTLSASSASTVTVNFATADDTAAVGSNTVTNSAAITIQTSGNAVPYPSTITVAGVGNPIAEVSVMLDGVNHTYSSDVDILLVGPNGQSVILMSDAGGSFNGAVDIDLTFDDDGAGFVPTGFASGTYKPTNISDGEGGDVWGSPAPPSGYGSTMSVFDGTDANGTWSLYIVDDVAGDSGSITGGWSINILTPNGGDFDATSGTVIFSPGDVSETILVPVFGDTAVEPSETFFVNLSAATNATIFEGQGVGTITDDDGTLVPPTNVVATATGPTSVDVSWTAAPGPPASYRVYRSANAIDYILVGSPVGTTLTDTIPDVNAAYLYKVRSFAGSESGDSNIDLATRVVLTDPTLTAGVSVKLAHFTDLLDAVNAVRDLASQASIAFTVPAPGTDVTVRRQHVLDLRSGLDAARLTLALSAVTYTDDTIVAGSTIIKEEHINDLRSGVK